MVETAEADVVSGAVAGDDPLTAGGEEVAQLDDVAADVAAACLAQGQQFGGDFACCGGVLAVFEPLAAEGLHLVGAAGAALHLVHQVCKTVTELVGADLHAQAEFGEVLEQGVCPCGAVAVGIGGIGRGGHRAGVDR